MQYMYCELFCRVLLSALSSNIQDETRAWLGFFLYVMLLCTVELNDTTKGTNGHDVNEFFLLLVDAC